ncbi:dual specificity phosphatase [Klosneuvirus KNV1]|uniref:Dual specificity phosphatase n=1 Tax=Klosneuvirus KNV1 TaxID=1977640 RepID=A0A1V0SIN0_9VIRU|nr:dual specificity phosphatase [Klosneuvirus KNV1]
MKRYMNYVTSGIRVLYDKTYDYGTYYLGYNNEEDSTDSNDDAIQDYEGVLKIELYQDENNNKRIYPASGKYNEYTTFFSEPTHVIDNIYLGSAFNAATYDTLKKYNIKVIINATSEISNYYPNEFVYKRCRLYDNNKHSIKKYLEESFNDIQYHQQHTGGNILIHCFMGASRSASIVLYYLMRTKKHEDGKPYSFDDAVTYLRNLRIIVNPTFRLTKDLASSILPQ